MSAGLQLEDLLISAEVNWLVEPEGKASLNPTIIVRITDLDRNPIIGLGKRNFSVHEMSGLTEVPFQVVEFQSVVGFLAGTYNIKLDVSGIFKQKGQVVYILKVSRPRSIGQVITSVVKLA